MIYVLHHTVAICSLAVALWLPGYLFLPTGLPLDARLRPLARMVLGVGLWITALFLLAVLGLLDAWSLWTIILLLLVTALRKRPPSDSRALLSEAGGRRSAYLVPVGLLAVCLVPLFFLAMSPPVSWDANAYHLTVAKLFAQHNGFREVSFNVYSYWPMNIQLLFAMAMELDDYILAKLLHFAFGFATLYALFIGCSVFYRPASGVLAMWLFAANGVVIYEMRVAYVDLASAFFLVAGFLFMLAARERDEGALWLSGLSLGLLAGIKITGIASAGIIGMLYLPRLLKAARQRALLPTLRPFLLRFALPIMALWAPWVVRTAWLTGNPFYPFFHQLLGGPDWSPALSDRFQAWQSAIGMGRETLDYLLLPARVILAGGEGYQHFDGKIGWFWIAVLPLALWTAKRVALVRACLGISGLLFLFWSASSQQMRFLIPVLTLLAIAGGAAVIEVLDRLPTTAWRRTGFALAVLALAGVMVASHGRVLTAGYRTLGIFVNTKGDLSASARHPAYRFINETLPSDAKLLFLNTNQAFFCDREVIADSFFEASQIADWLAPAEDQKEIHRLLTARSVSHVLVENRHRGAVYPPTLAAFLRDPTFAQPLYRSEDGRFSILRLR